MNLNSFKIVCIRVTKIFAVLHPQRALSHNMAPPYNFVQGCRVCVPFLTDSVGGWLPMV